MRSILVAVALVAVSCSSSNVADTPDAPENPTTPEAADADDPTNPRELWAEQRPDRYRLTTRVECFCFELPAWMDIVEGDESVEHLELLTGAPGDSFGPTGPRTMAALFDYVEALEADMPEGGLVEVVTDGSTGAIQRIEVDPLPDAVDDEWTLVVEMTALTPEQPGVPAVLPADVDLATLTEPLECPNAIGWTSTDRTQSLLVAHFETPPIEEAYRDVALPHHQWEVRVVVGATPSGAGCESATSPERVAEAHAVAGRLTAIEPGQTACDPIEIRIDDLQIEDGRGGRTLLGSTTVRGVFRSSCDRVG